MVVVILSCPAVVLIIPVPGVCAVKFGLFCRRSAGRFLRLACNAGRSNLNPILGDCKIDCGSVVAHSVNPAILRALLGQLVQCAPQSVSNKLYRDSFTFDEVVSICESLDADVRIITRDTNKEF